MKLTVQKPSYMTDEEWKKVNLANMISEALVSGFTAGFRKSMDAIDDTLHKAIAEKTVELKSKANLGFDVQDIKEEDWINAFKEVITNINFGITIDNFFKLPAVQESITLREVVKPAGDKGTLDVVTPLGTIHATW